MGMMKRLAAAALWLVGGMTAQGFAQSDEVGEILPETPAPEIAVATLAQPDPGYEAFFDGAIGAQLIDKDLHGAVAVVVEGGEIVFLKGYGYKDPARLEPVDPSTTLFRVASISKTFMATVVMQLVEEGRLDLDADINEYITQFEIPATFAEPITMRHLLTHTPGFEDLLVGAFKRQPVDDLAAQLEAEMPKRVRAPGLQSSYSNYGSALAGLIIANLTGQSFAEAVEERVFAPLGMEHASFREPDGRAFHDDIILNMKREGGQWIEAEPEYWAAFAPAGGLRASGEDIGRFMLAHLGEGAGQEGRILSEEAALRMREPLFTPHPALPSMLFGFYESSANGNFVYGHGGNTILIHSNMAMMPEKELGVFFSFAGPEGAAGLGPVQEAFWDRYAAAGADPRPAAGDEMDLEPVLGNYRPLRRGYSNIEKVVNLPVTVTVSESEEGGLLVNFAGSAQRFVAAEGEPFLFRSVDDPFNQIAFLGTEDGAASYIVGNFPGTMLGRISVWQTTNAAFGVLGLGAVFSVLIVVGLAQNPGAFFRASAIDKTGRIILFAASTVAIAFVVMFASVMDTPADQFIFDWLKNGALLLSLPVVVAALVAAGYLLVPAVAKARHPMGTVRYVASLLILTAFLSMLFSWNLVGPWNL